VVSSWVLVDRAVSDTTSFDEADLSKLVTTNLALMLAQPFRMYTLAVLSDGYRFQVFRISRATLLDNSFDTFSVANSSLYLGMQGWQVRVCATSPRVCSSFLLTTCIVAAHRLPLRYYVKEQSFSDTNGSNWSLDTRWWVSWGRADTLWCSRCNQPLQL
jgi:hypothetical protein